MVSIDWDISSSIADWLEERTLLNFLEYVAVGWIIICASLLTTYALSHVASHRPFIEGVVLLLCGLLASGIVVCAGSSRLRQRLSRDEV